MWENTSAEAFDVSARPLSVVLAETQGEISRKNARWHNPKYLQRLEETINFLDLAYKGAIPTHRLQEVLSTSDFPILFGDVVDRTLLNGYAELPTSWQMFSRRGTVRDFRAAKRIALDGLEKPFSAAFEKPELQNVKYDNDLSEAQYTVQVKVYEKGFAFNWRMMIDEDLDFMRTFPTRMARGARRTEERFVTSLLMDSSGPDATFFSNANKNLINTTNGAASNNPALSVQGLRDAFAVINRQVDSGGDPIYIDGAILAVPPALEITARELLRAMSINFNPGVTSGIGYNTANWLGDKLKLVVLPYAPIINTTSGHTAWYMFADPNANRPAVEVSFLRGYEQPMMLQKAPNTQRMGGGVDPTLGDFEDMSLHYKGLHIMGGSLIDPKAAVASTGAGS
jgi:hypothetical protein